MRLGGFVTYMAFALTTLWFGTHPASAQAGARAEAHKHFTRALELVEEEDYEGAVVEFQHAYDIKPHYSVLYNIGMAYVALGDPVKAAETLSRYLREGGTRIPQKRYLEVEEEVDRQRARIAYITVRAEPPGTMISIDAQPMGKSPFDKPLALGVGMHTITATQDGYQPRELRIALAGEEHKEVDIALQPIPFSVHDSTPAEALVPVSVKCAVPDVRITIGDEMVGKTPLADPIPVLPGVHRVGFAREGYMPNEHKVTIRPRTATSVKCGIQPLLPLPASAAARLELNISEQDAAALLDGEPLPANGVIPRGRHHLEVRRRGFETWQRDITVEIGRSQPVNVHLVPEEAYLQEYKMSAQATRLWAYVLGGGGVVIGGTALGVFLWNDGRFDDWQNEDEKLKAAFEGKPPYPPELNLDQRQNDNNSLLESIHTWDVITAALAITGGALLVGGTILFVVGDDPDQYDKVVAQVHGDGATIAWNAKW